MSASPAAANSSQSATAGRQLAARLLLFLAVAVGAFVVSLGPISDGDIYWHVAAGRELIGPRGGIELIGAAVLAAEIAGWQRAWPDSVYGSPGGYTIPPTLVIGFLAAAVVALAMARRNPVPLVAITVLSPLMLAVGFVSIAQALLGNVDGSIALADDAVPLGLVAFLGLASLLALRRARSRALG